MNNSEPRIPEEIVPEVFALASRLYAQNKPDYSLEELMQAGREAKIPRLVYSASCAGDSSETNPGSFTATES